jgi:hypothetical protein
MNQWIPLSLALAASGCFVDDRPLLDDDFGQCATPAPPPVPPDRLLTYWQDAKPIIDARCTGCHTEGGVAPFALESYQDAFRYRSITRHAVATGVMPPWQPDDCCNDYLWDRSLPTEEREVLLGWIDQGAAEGDPADEGSPLEVDRGGLSRVDLTLTMPEPFEPRRLIGADEVRCFVLDHVFDDDVWVTGIDVAPGDRSMVHHVIVYTVDQSDLPALRAREGADGRPGWDCYGEFAGDATPTGSIGGWAPGYHGVEFPHGLGRQIPAGSALVLNMHYDTGSGVGVDQSQVQLMLADQVDKEATGTGIVNPLWLIDDGMHIAAGDPDAVAWFAYEPTIVFGDHRGPIDIYAVNQHMHELGTIGRLAILRGDGSVDCLLNISDWDFDWLGEYWLREPVTLYPGDRLYVECHWDNSAGNQKIVDGEQQVARDLAWGTDQEMCAGVLTIVPRTETR